MRKKYSTSSGFLIPRLALSGGLFLAAGFLAFYSFAATPPSGTLTDTSGPITYTSGPFLISNPSATAELDCVNLPCDDFGLTVDVPPSYAMTHNMVITTSWPNPGEDYDVYLRSDPPPGTADVRDAASSSNPEVIVVDAALGQYTVRIVPFAVAGGTTTTRIELRLKPSNPPPAPPSPGTPRFHNFPSPPDLGNNSGEPTLATGRPIDGQPGGRTMYISGLETLRVTWNDCSSPASAPGFGEDNTVDPALTIPLWEDKSAPQTSITSLDPILFGDMETGRVFVSQLGPKTSFLALTDDDGESYLPSQGSPINPGVDHQTIGGGPYSPTLEPVHPLYENASYYASQDIAVAQLGRSDDGGVTFGPAVPMYNLTQCGGLHGHIKVTPRSPLTEVNGHLGTVYVPNKGCGGQQAVVVSENNGVSFAVRPIPGSVSGPSDPSVGIDKVGKIYVAMADGTGRPTVAVSADKGVTWSTPRDVGLDFGLRNSVFPTAVGGDEGRATVMYLATDTPGNFQETGVFTGVWHIYAASTFDGGNTWTTVRVTPENDPVQRGSICAGGTTCGGDRNLLDFNDMEIDQQGRVIMSYADGCIGCTSPTGADSRSEKATIARQSGGRRMLTASSPQEDDTAIVPAAPLVTTVARSNATTVHLEWKTPDNGGAPILSYNIFRRVVGGAYGAALANVSAAKTDYDDATASSATSYEYKVTAINSEGEGENCGDFLVGDPIDLGTSCILPGLLQLGPDPDTGGLSPTGGGPGTNILTVHIAQPFLQNAADPILLVFTITTDPNPTGTMPVGSSVFVSFNAPDVQVRGVRMRFLTPTPTFESYIAAGNMAGNADGRFFDPASLKPAEPSSNYDGPAGKITIVVKASDLAAIPGQALTGFNSASTATTDPADIGAGATLTFDEVPNGLARGATSYTVQPNAQCSPNAAPIAALTAVPQSGSAPLVVDFDASGSFDPDSGDTIASYTYNFGDGSVEVTKTCSSDPNCATAQHTYNDEGNFVASVRVTDSRGEESVNSAQQVITVGSVFRVVSRKTHGTVGDFEVDLPGSGPRGIECRRPGPNDSHTMVFKFPSVVTSVGSVTVAADDGSPGASGETNSEDPSEYIVTLTNVNNAQYLTVTLNNVVTDDETFATVEGRMGILLGDVDEDTTVGSGDVFLVRQQNPQLTNSSNFRLDVNTSGSIESGDVFLVRGKNPSGFPSSRAKTRTRSNARR